VATARAWANERDKEGAHTQVRKSQTNRLGEKDIDKAKDRKRESLFEREKERGRKKVRDI